MQDLSLHTCSSTCKITNLRLVVHVPKRVLHVVLYTAGPAIELHEHDSILILATEGVRTSGFLRCNTLGQDLQIMMAPTSETAPVKS